LVTAQLTVFCGSDLQEPIPFCQNGTCPISGPAQIGPAERADRTRRAARRCSTWPFADRIRMPVLIGSAGGLLIGSAGAPAF